MPGEWSWTDAWIFIALFVGIRVLFIWCATWMFINLIPGGDCCPLCDGHTLAIERSGWWRILGANFRRSWCLDCGWEGVLRRDGKDSDQSARSIANNLSQSGQLPLISKKSSK